MQAADAGMGVPGAFGAVFREDVVEPLGVIGEVVERDGGSPR